MDVLRYSPQDKEGCLALFTSNQDRFFDDSELSDFKQFLSGEVNQIDYFVVKGDDGIVGCGGFSQHNDEVYLRWGMIDRNRHKQGVGSLLLSHRLTKIKEKYGAVVVKLDTSQHTEAFYRKHGFNIDAVVKDGFGPDLDNVSMSLVLDGYSI